MKKSDPPVTVMTTTNEVYLPTRLVYRVLDADALKSRFRNLRCFSWDASGRRWTWDYGPEARKVGFPAAYAALPPECQPVVLASCYLVDRRTLHVYTRCAERATKFLVFFDRQVPRSVALGEFLDEYNVVTTVSPGQMLPVPEDVFKDESQLEVVDPPQIPAHQAAQLGPAEALALLHSLTGRKQSRMERHPLGLFYAEGPEPFEGEMRLRVAKALLQHKSGQPARSYDFLDDLIRRVGGEPPS